MLSIIRDAGWPIWPLLATSVVALALIIERLLALRADRVVPSGQLAQAATLAARPNVPADALADLAARSAVGQILASGLKARHLSRERVREAMEDTGRQVTHELERYLSALGTIAAVAPLMGLFGTVIGMIEIFSGWSPTGGDPAQLARGISIALYNTAFGIFVAIPALICQRWFRARVAGYVVAMEQAASRLLDTLRPESSR
ncbi:MotA/TolQ/ExbB proton channel family protein [Achromobacter sp. GG226]|uniref:MotA/TolQ/ExbB proton channel family protein n=1 Tax=Verticiella alkaliphila TaxID=2779529 RepID=UPI001C0CDB48|nr:MotA/TolQ/ExbB proton channel family protein [Verticiella sp. GG226]MBU4609218.1 MotA/TolQ/ExbB proton channel family protein [Verticiella sp. GG226]